MAEFGQEQCSPLNIAESAKAPMAHFEQMEFEENSDGVEYKLPSTDEENEARGNWSRKTEYILSLLGYSIGLSNLWRFPFLCYRNGGGAFLIPYWICMFFCGVPLFFLEVSLGQFTGKSAVSVWTLAPIFKGVGYATIMITLIITAYYQILMAHVVYYFINSFTLGELPWKRCGNPWNTANCLDYNNQTLRNAYNQFLNWKDTGDLGNLTDQDMDFFGNRTFRPPAEEFFLYKAINLGGSLEDMGPIVWHIFLCLIPTWIATFLCLIKGVKSVGKAVYFTATFPYVMLTALIIRGVTLPGAMKGLKFYLVPDFKRLAEANVWCDAAFQVFFGLGPGWGGLITMGSYNRFHNKCYSDGIFAPIAMGVTSFYAGFAVFSVAGFMSEVIGRPVGEVVDQGPQLAFVMYPEVLTRLPLAPLWSLMFFFMLFTLGLDSMFVMVETAVTVAWDELPDKYKVNRVWILLGTCFVLFAASIPATTRAGIYLFQIVDMYTATHTLIIVCSIELISVAWIYGAERFVDDIKCMIGYHPSVIIWSIIWRFITLAFCLLILLVAILRWTPLEKYMDYTYPQWSKGLGAFFFLSTFIWIPGWAIFAFIRAPGNTLKQDWGPALQSNKEEWNIYRKYPPYGQSLVKRLRRDRHSSET